MTGMTEFFTDATRFINTNDTLVLLTWPVLFVGLVLLGVYAAKRLT